MENVIWETRGTALVLTCSGEITMEVTHALKREVERKLEGGGTTALVLDLSEVSFMDSSGIGFLVACNTRMQSAGKGLVLYRPSSQVRKTLGLVQLMDRFDAAETESELIAKLEA